ncbi:MAG: cytochrome c, partial [Phycisphaerales bacterium]|nr:cytochrome c [Phycisphaerales bacterium]
MLAFLLSLPVLATSATDTWADVSPIVSRNCSTCHHDDGAGPFPLLSHADVSQRRSFIAEVLRRKLMPPWLPGDEGVTLHDDRSMPEADRNRLIAWLDAGAPTKDGI